MNSSNNESDLKALLSTNACTKIFSYYEKNNELNATIRRILIAAVVDYFVANRIKIGTKDCNILADKIVEIFPNEDKSNYFIAGSGKVNAKGGLYTKYNNQIRLYRTKGLIEETPKRSKGSAKNDNTDIEIEQYSEESSMFEIKSEACDTDDFTSGN